MPRLGALLCAPRRDGGQCLSQRSRRPAPRLAARAGGAGREGVRARRWVASMNSNSIQDTDTRRERVCLTPPPLFRMFTFYARLCMSTLSRSPEPAGGAARRVRVSDALERSSSQARAGNARPVSRVPALGSRATCEAALACDEADHGREGAARAADMRAALRRGRRRRRDVDRD